MIQTSPIPETFKAQVAEVVQRQFANARGLDGTLERYELMNRLRNRAFRRLRRAILRLGVSAGEAQQLRRYAYGETLQAMCAS